MAEATGGGASTGGSDGPDGPGGSDVSYGSEGTEGSGASDGPEGSDSPEGSDGPVGGGSRTVPAGRRARLVALAGVPVHGNEGDTVGRVRDIYLHDATGELAAISVVRRQLSSRHVVIPAAAIAELPAAAPERPKGSGGADDAERADDDARDDDSGHAGDAPQVIRLLIDAVTARGGVRPPQNAHLTPELLQEAHRVLGLEEPAEA